jgi:PHP domain
VTPEIAKYAPCFGLGAWPAQPLCIKLRAVSSSDQEHPGETVADGARAEGSHVEGVWPGSHWWRCDLHVHTAASHDFEDREATPADIVAAARAAGLHAVAVTDHNSAASVDEVVENAGPDLVVFPAVELTSVEGAHLLVLFDPGATGDAIKAFLGRCGVRGGDFGQRAAKADVSYLKCMELADEAEALCIAAHADRKATQGSHETSLLHVLREGEPRQDVLRSTLLAAVELSGDDEEAERVLCRNPADDTERRPHIRGSDAHALNHIGRSSAWIKMTKPTLEGLRLAFADGQASVQLHDGADPNQSRASLNIEEIEISSAKLIGRGEPFVFRLNPWLNAIIGGRGTGKSSVVEFLRLALAREQEIPAALEDGFAKFARIPAGRDDRGMLTDDTEVAVIYRKDDSRFRVRWTTAGGRTIEEQIADGRWQPSQGDVAQRFPVRIYSQKQVFELAEGPEALLRVIDDAHQVDAAGWKEQWRSTAARFLALRAEEREIRTALAEIGRLTGELADVERKLSVFEGSDHAAVLRDYSHRQDQQAAVEDFDEQLASIADQLREAGKGVDASFAQGSFAEDALEDAALITAAARREQWVIDLREQINQLAADVDQQLAGWRTDPARAASEQAIQAATRSYSELMKRLEAEGAGSISDYADLVEERKQIQARLHELKDEGTRLAETERQAQETLAALLALRRELTERRENFLRDVLSRNKHVRIEIQPYGDRESAEPELRQLLGTAAFANDIAADDGRSGLLPDLFGGFDELSTLGFEQRIAEMRTKLIDCARGDRPTWNLRDRRFAEHLRTLTDEAVDRLAFWSPRDTVRVSYSREGDGQNFRPIEQGSPGQKTAAILAFLLAYGDEPIVLDQPEDDLDNRLIYDLVVRQLRANKRRRQIITVTHNPNIVVNGDAEYVAVMEFPERLGQVTVHEDGGLQERLVREEICAVMEGGRDAFEQRYRRIGRQHSRAAEPRGVERR